MAKPRAFEPTLTWNGTALPRLPFHAEVIPDWGDKRVGASSECLNRNAIGHRKVEKSQDSTRKGIRFQHVRDDMRFPPQRPMAESRDPSRKDRHPWNVDWQIED